MMEHEKRELMELRHEPVPGYLKALVAAFAVGVAYLGYIFLVSAGTAGH